MIEFKVNEHFTVIQEAKDKPFYFYDDYYAIPVYRSHFIEGDNQSDELLEFDTLDEAVNWANDTFKKRTAGVRT